MINAGMHGAVTWVDLSTPDVMSAVTFYRELLGWSEVEESETPMGTYFIGKVDGQQVGGMMAQGPELAGTPPMWTMFVYCDDVDATAARVMDAGGTVLMAPSDIPSARIAVIADPAGAVFGLFGGPSIEGEFYSEDVGRVCWVELMSRDTAAAEGFYADLFGWKTVTEHTSPASGAPYMSFKLGDEDVAGMMAMPDEVPDLVPSYWSAYFTVADCDLTVEKARDLGGQVYLPTTTMDMGKFASLADPQGAPFNIMEYVRSR